MPILDITFTTPLEAALTKFAQALAWSMPERWPSRIMSSIVSKAT